MRMNIVLVQKEVKKKKKRGRKGGGEGEREKVPMVDSPFLLATSALSREEFRGTRTTTGTFRTILRSPRKVQLFALLVIIDMAVAIVVEAISTVETIGSTRDGS